MIITLIALWFAVGLLAAWVDHTYVRDGEMDTDLFLTLMISISGPVALLIASIWAISRRCNLSFTVFKAKK